MSLGSAPRWRQRRGSIYHQSGFGGLQATQDGHEHSVSRLAIVLVDSVNLFVADLAGRHHASPLESAFSARQSGGGPRSW